MSYLGRYRQGQRVPVYVRTSALPDDVPSVGVYNDDGGLISTKQVPATQTPCLFFLPLFLGQELSEGRYRVVQSYLLAGVITSQVDHFEVVGGGDPGGQILSMQFYDRPEARYLLAQLEGRLVQGKNPRF